MTCKTAFQSKQNNKIQQGGGGGGRNFNHKDNIETDNPFKCHDTRKYIVKKDQSLLFFWNCIAKF